MTGEDIVLPSRCHKEVDNQATRQSDRVRRWRRSKKISKQVQLLKAAGGLSSIHFHFFLSFVVSPLLLHSYQPF